MITLFDSDLAEWEYMQEQEEKENENEKENTNNDNIWGYKIFRKGI